MKKNIFRITTLILSVITGCTIVDSSAIVTGNTRSPILVEEVRIYRIAPDHFEEIAIVFSSAGHDFKKNSSLMNSAIQRLKEEAAKLGANGVLLSNIDERDAPSVTTSHGTTTASGNGSTVYASDSSASVNRGDSHTRISGLAIHTSLTSCFTDSPSEYCTKDATE